MSSSPSLRAAPPHGASDDARAGLPVLRAARADDRVAIERLLAASALPVVGIRVLLATHPDDFVVADDPTQPGALAAVGGLEICGDAPTDALLRSVAVAPAWRARGLGEALVHRLIADAEARGLGALYLLTTTAERWFPRFGFAAVARDAVPAAIAATDEFRGACPASALAMWRASGRAGASAQPSVQP